MRKKLLILFITIVVSIPLVVYATSLGDIEKEIVVDQLKLENEVLQKNIEPTNVDLKKTIEDLKLSMDAAIEEHNAEIAKQEAEVERVRAEALEKIALKKYVDQRIPYIMSQNNKLTELEAREIINAILLETKKYPDLNPDLVLLQIRQESNFQKHLVGTHQDSGLLQILPGTARGIAKGMKLTKYDLFNINDNIKMGAWYLNGNIQVAKKHSKNQDIQVNLGLVAYNAGPRAFSYFKSTGKYKNQYYNHVLDRKEVLDEFIK